MSIARNIFISYSRADEEVVADLRSRLKEAGIPLWIDHESIRAGDEWRHAIDDAIAGAAAIVVVVSRHSANSQYVTYEWSLARGLGIPIVPIRIDDSAAHPRLSALQHFDFSQLERASWEDLFTRLRQAIDASGIAQNSAQVEVNPRLIECKPRPKMGNCEWLRYVGGLRTRDEPSVTLVLMGGTALLDFYVRVAQSWMRQDGLPSSWSQVGVILDNDWQQNLDRDRSKRLRLATVSLDSAKALDSGTNGIETTTLGKFNNPTAWPNFAIIRFPVAERRSAEETISALQHDRSLLDIVTLARPWLTYSPGHNALPFRVGVPSAVFALDVLAKSKAPIPKQIPLTSGTPEWLWQIARWWHEWDNQEGDIEGVYKMTSRHPTIGKL